MSTEQITGPSATLTESQVHEAAVQVHGDTAVLSHDVLTTTSTNGREETTRERETIVFRLIDGDLLAVHEHLSAQPEDER